jgi:c(7)-type cytochrome triheme protein
MRRIIKPKRLVLILLVLVPLAAAWAEFGDVVYPHWFHRIRFQCSVCHVDIGFKTKAGASGITMDQISQGRFCGACHNGEIAWSVENCDFCHSGVPGLETGVQGGHETSGPGYW